MHLALFLGPLGISLPESQVHSVFKGFIRILIQSGKRNLIAFYTKFLPLEMQIDMYSEFLKGKLTLSFHFIVKTF